MISQSAFWDELTKIAAEPFEEQRAQNNMGRLVGGGLGLAGSHVLGTGLTAAAGESLMQDMAANPMSTNIGEMQKLRDVMAPGTNIHMHKGGIEGAMNIPKGGIMPGLLRGAEEQAYRQRGIPEEVFQKGLKEGLVITPGKAGAHIGAHELGHAAFGNTGVGKVVRKLRVPGMLAASVAAPTMAIAADPDSRASKYAPLVGLAGIAPVLGEEAYASFKGYGALKRLGASPQALKTGRRQLAKAWGTYGAKMGIPAVAAPIAIRQIRKYMARRAAEKAQPAAVAE